MTKISESIQILGEYFIFTFKILKSFSFIPKRFFEIVIQIKRIGIDSIILIVVTSGFTGLVTAVQAYQQTKGHIPMSYIGVMIQKATMLELAPVLTGLVLCGKIGASLAAELGSMKITEQIDALKTMSIDPINYLYMPRVIAGIVILPLLVIIANVVGLVTGFILSFFKYNVTFNQFFFVMKAHFEAEDLWSGLIKAIFFGFTITVTATFVGSKTVGGAEGVGNSATNAAVISSILILLMDFLVAALLFGIVR